MIKILYFTSATCRPCKQFLPIAESVCKMLELDFEIVSVDEHPDKARYYSVSSVPTTMITKNNQIMNSIVGATSRYDYEKKIRNAMR